MLTNLVATVLVSWTTNVTETPGTIDNQTRTTIIEEWTAVSFDLEGRRRSIAVKEPIYRFDSFQIKLGTNWVEQGTGVIGATNLARIKVETKPGIVELPVMPVPK